MPVNSLKGEIQALELADVESIETGKSFIRNWCAINQDHWGWTLYWENNRRLQSNDK